MNNEILNLTVEEAIDLLKKAFTRKMTQLTAEQSAVVWEMIQARQIEPVRDGLSLHCASLTYVIDGVEYEALWELTDTTSPPMITQYTEWDS